MMNDHLQILKESVKHRLIDYLRSIGAEPEQRNGKWRARCPIHDDRHPSFLVSDKSDGQVWHCFVCADGGDVLSLHKRLHGGTFPEVLLGVARVLGEPAPDLSRPRSYRKGSNTLRQTPSRKVIGSAGPGPLPEGFEKSHRAARFRLYESSKLQDQIAAELGVQSETIRRMTMGGDALGWAHQPYYLRDGKWKKTDPNKLVYTYPAGIKIRHPFGPHNKCRYVWAVGHARLPWRAHLLKRPEVRQIYLMEGESDGVAALDAGLENLHPDRGEASAVVACPGTSFKDEWAPLFRGKTVTISFDADPAGQDAADRVAALLYPYAARVRILRWKGLPA